MRPLNFQATFEKHTEKSRAYPYMYIEKTFAFQGFKKMIYIFKQKMQVMYKGREVSLSS